MSNGSDSKRDLFISFNQADRPWAAWIAWVLEENGYSVFFQDWDFRGNFVEHMNLAHGKTYRTLAVLSDNYFGSDFTLAEWSARFAQDPAARQDRLVSVKVGSLSGESILRPVVYADLTDCPEQEAQERLLGRVRKAMDATYRSKPATRPGFPGRPSRQFSIQPVFPNVIEKDPSSAPTLTPREYIAPLVISVHDDVTAGSCQKILADTLSQHRIKHKAYDFGRYDLARLDEHDSYQSKIDEFYDFYGEVLTEKCLGIKLADYKARPSLIAHGFGTYIVGRAMERFPDIQFDKMILCGSILSPDFDWSTLFHRDQVNLVRNEYAPQYMPTSSTATEVGRVGSSGLDGFHVMSSVILQERFENFSHRNYFHKRHIESHWLPVLKREPSPLVVRHGRNMNDGVHQFDEAFEATGSIDNLCFSDFENFKEIPDGRADEWIEIEPDIYTFLFDRRTDVACGYVNAMPVTDECFDLIMQGTKDDPDIKGVDVLKFLPNQDLKMYLMSVAIHPQCRRVSQGLLQEPLERLVNGLVGKLYHYAVQYGICVTELAAVGWTTPGVKLCRALGMVEKGRDQNNRPIYYLDFKSATPPHSIFPSVRRLAETYKRIAAKRL